MDIMQLQTALNKLNLGKPLRVDGIAGKMTMDAVDALLTQSGAEDWQDWVDSRRRIAAEQLVYEGLHIEVGEIDGLVGEQTRYARSVWEVRQKNQGKPDPKVENWRDVDTGPLPPAVAPRTLWPKQSDVQSFYGTPGHGFVLMEMPFPLRIAWEPAKTVMRVSVHGKCKAAFARVWQNTLLHYGYEELKRLRLDMFGGCANVRKMRGGSSWSMHAFACAWDVDPDRNQLKWKREMASLDNAPYSDFWRIVYAEGALSLGRERNYDWMHFQFTRDLS